MSYPIPAGLDPKLEYYLKGLELRVIALEEKTGIATDGGTEDELVSGASGFDPVPDTESVLANQSTGTEDAWTTVASGAPSEARFAKILFRVNSTDNNDDGDLKWRTDSASIASPSLVECVALADDARDSVIDWVTLDSSGSFQYLFTNTSGTSIDWSITYCGYSL